LTAAFWKIVRHFVPADSYPQTHDASETHSSHSRNPHYRNPNRLIPMNSHPCCETSRPETVAEPSFVDTPPVFSTRDDEAGTRLHVALPGVKKEDLKLTFHDGALHLEAIRPNAKTPLRYRLSARLASRLDGNAVSANLEHGVLEVHVPLKAEAQPRSIAIQ
jgi:HSP20 family protein